MWVVPIAALCALAGCGRFGFGGSEPDARDAGDGAPDAPPAIPGLVARYPLDDDPGDGELDDALGARPARCVVGVTCPSRAIGRIGDAMRFDGVGAVLRITDDGAFATAGVTVAAWVYTEDPTFDQVAFAKPYLDGSSDSWAFVAWTTGPTCFETTIAGDMSEDVCNDAALPGARWMHVAGAWEGTMKSLYLDGVRVAQQTAAAPIVFDGHDLLIGADENGGNTAYAWHGLVDELHIYDRALTDPEILMLAGE